MIYGVNCTAVVGNPTYVKWARYSAMTAKRHMPDVRTSIYTNRPEEVRDKRWGEFTDDVLEGPDYEPIDWQGAMIDGILASEPIYDVTLFVGADSIICDDMRDVFDLMGTGRFDIALTQPRDQRKRHYPLRGVHEGFSYYDDAGVFFYWNDATRKFCQDWRELFDTHKVECASSKKPDTRMHPTQPAFNEALYHNNELRMVFLPVNYNEHFWTGCLYGKCKIFHAHGMGAEKADKAARKLNENWEKPRLFRDKKFL